MKKCFLIAVLVSFTACTQVIESESSTQLTAGLVQREIRIGMPASDVAVVLGSPNIVTLDENKDETWVYDKVSTQVEYCATREGVWLVLACAQKRTFRSKSNQKTLIVIVKFDQDKLVKDFTYRQSSF
jgi:outer membrane protein assembly factor BamE (lipoprotein component of BamABCDE complex)